MSTITRLAVTGILAASVSSNVVGQGSRNEVACGSDWMGGNRSSVQICESRELTLTPEDSLQVNSRPNGSVSVAGWDRNEIEIRALVHSWGRSEEMARDILDEIEIDTDGVIRAYGPDVHNSWWPFGRSNGGWSVSFEIMAPHDTALWIETVNGRVEVTDMRGNVDAETTNGGITLTDVSGAVRGRTVNGGISAELTDNTFNGEIFDVRTTNGSVVIHIPEDFSARLDVETVNGGVKSDFPVNREGHRNREVTATWGSGGPLIRARTVNGGVQIRQL